MDIYYLFIKNMANSQEGQHSRFEELPTYKVAFYNEEGYVIDIKEVRSLVPKETLISNAQEQYPDLAERATSIRPTDPNILLN